MPRRKGFSTAELELARDMGAATYLSSFIWLMGDQLEVKDLTNDSVNAMAILMIEPLNLATELAFRKMMGDEEGVTDAILRLRRAIDLLPTPEI